MKIIIPILAGISTVSFAGEKVKLQMQLTFKGHVDSPVIIANYNEEAAISTVDENGDGYQISVRPSQVQKNSPDEKPSVELFLRISEVINHHPKVVATPRIISLLGEEAQLTQLTGSEQTLSLGVLPTAYEDMATL